ncbi:MAG: hypothetical protein ABIE68_03115 [bacterium]
MAYKKDFEVFWSLIEGDKDRQTFSLEEFTTQETFVVSAENVDRAREEAKEVIVSLHKPTTEEEEQGVWKRAMIHFILPI